MTPNEPTTEATEADTYTAEKIRVLDNIEAVRKRPAMYIGDTSTRGLHHLVEEVVGNAVDEAMAGHCKNIEIALQADGSCAVTDDGSGIPVDIHKATGKSALEVVMTMLHAGGKFDHDTYKVSGGLHGVGVTCVNALSEWLTAEVRRGGVVYFQEYARGIPATPVERRGITKTRGTRVTFKPDAEIFETTEFSYDAVIARSIPPNMLQKMGASSLQTLDKLMLEPSKLAPERQQALRDAYAKLSPLPDAQLAYRIEFRSAPQIGPNAFALPDGNIVMLDELVALTQDDDEIIAVLAHERGHVEQRHALRMVLQSSAVGLAMTWYMGDVSSLLATVPAMLVQASYSRDMEREADEYAARTLQLNAKSPCLLPDILQKLEAAHAKRQAEARKENGGSVMDYLASHPATQERSAWLCPAH